MLTFGRYEALFKIAAGGMAEVYAARIRGEAGFEKLVAVKRMLPHLTDDAEFSSMFLDEGRLAANIASPNVVSTLDLGRADDGALYIVMELVVGVALSSLIKASAKLGRLIPVPIACEILAQAASGLDDAHEARTPTGVHLGIVHRDVSPQNVLVGADGRVRVVDFGVARALLRQTHTSTGTLKGKFAYFSPEQAAAKDVDRRSDVFALGIVAWETLLNRRLFDGENPLDQIQRVREMAIPIPSTLRPDLPRAVSDVVMQALQRDPRKRLQSASAFAAAMREAVGVVPGKDIARYVGDVSAEQIREMQLRIESALAGEHVDTHVLRPSKSGEKQEVSIQATPSSMPGRVADLPTLIRSADGSIPPPAGARSFHTPPPMARRGERPDRRAWAFGVGISVVLIALLGAALASQQPVGEPIATPLGSTPLVRSESPREVAPVVVAPAPTPEVVLVPSSTPSRDVHTRPDDHGAEAVAPPPVAPHQDPAPLATHVEPAPTATPTPRDPPTRPRVGTPDRTHGPAGLVGDDAFDRGL
jgi:eukaryotic-like serine/threonine-protein kinase